MAQQPDQRPNNNKNRNGNGGGGNGPDPNFNWRGLILFALAIILIGVFYVMNGKMGQMGEVPLPKLLEYIAAGQVIKDDPQKPVELVEDRGGAAVHYLSGWYRPTPESQPTRFKTPVNLEFNRNLKADLEK